MRSSSWTNHRPGLARDAHDRRIPEAESQRHKGAHRRLEIGQPRLFGPIEQAHGDLRMLQDEVAAPEEVAQRRRGGGRGEMTQRFLGGGAYRAGAAPQVEADDASGLGVDAGLRSNAPGDRPVPAAAAREPYRLIPDPRPSTLDDRGAPAPREPPRRRASSPPARTSADGARALARISGVDEPAYRRVYGAERH
jgi:hypothetical protein